jgi:hypothetical protein
MRKFGALAERLPRIFAAYRPISVKSPEPFGPGGAHVFYNAACAKKRTELAFVHTWQLTEMSSICCFSEVFSRAKKSIFVGHADLVAIVSSDEPHIVGKQNLDGGLRNTGPRAGSFSREFHWVVRLAAAGERPMGRRALPTRAERGTLFVGAALRFFCRTLDRHSAVVFCSAVIRLHVGQSRGMLVHVPANGDVISADLPRGTSGETEPIILGRCRAPRDVADALPHQPVAKLAMGNYGCLATSGAVAGDSGRSDRRIEPAWAARRRDRGCERRGHALAGQWLPRTACYRIDRCVRTPVQPPTKKHFRNWGRCSAGAWRRHVLADPTTPAPKRRKSCRPIPRHLIDDRKSVLRLVARGNARRSKRNYSMGSRAVDPVSVCIQCAPVARNERKAILVNTLSNWACARSLGDT